MFVDFYKTWSTTSVQDIENAEELFTRKISEEKAPFMIQPVSKEVMLSIGESKASGPDIHQPFLKLIGAKWMMILLMLYMDFFVKGKLLRRI